MRSAVMCTPCLNTPGRVTVSKHPLTAGRATRSCSSTRFSSSSFGERSDYTATTTAAPLRYFASRASCSSPPRLVSLSMPLAVPATVNTSSFPPSPADLYALYHAPHNPLFLFPLARRKIKDVARADAASTRAARR